MKDVTLVSPPTRSGIPVLRQGRCQIRLAPGVISWPPISLATLASLARERGRSVRLLDGGDQDRGFHEAVREVGSRGPSLVVVHATTPTIEDDLAFCRAIKACHPENTAIVFGPHVTALPEEAVRGGADAAVLGEPEPVIARLLESADDRPRRGLPGLCFRENGGILRTDPVSPPDLDTLPVPAWDLVDLHRYRMPLKQRPFGVVEVSRGCPHACSFCTAGPYHGHRWRPKSPERIAAEVGSLREVHGLSDFLFLSDTFNEEPDFVHRLCRELARTQPGIAWVCNSRVDRFDAASARAMRAAGCWLVSFGIESACPEVLSRTGKRTSPADTRRAVRDAREAGLKTFGYYLLGLPGDSYGTMARTVREAFRLDTDFANFYAATPFPGTDLYRQAEREGWLASRRWDRFFHGTSDVLALPGLAADRARRIAGWARLAYYARPRKAGRLLRVLAEERGRAG